MRHIDQGLQPKADCLNYPHRNWQTHTHRTGNKQAPTDKISSLTKHQKYTEVTHNGNFLYGTCPLWRLCDISFHQEMPRLVHMVAEICLLRTKASEEAAWLTHSPVLEPEVQPTSNAKTMTLWKLLTREWRPLIKRISDDEGGRS